jgi:hypothetical protein
VADSRELSLLQADFDLKFDIPGLLAASFRVGSTDEAPFDMLFGARLAQIKQELQLDLSRKFRREHRRPPTDGRSRLDVDQWDAIVGAKEKSHWAQVINGQCLTTSTSRIRGVRAYVAGGTRRWHIRSGGETSAIVWRYQDYELDTNKPASWT